MADPTLTNKLLILLGDGGTPTETFAHPCGANARSVTFTNNLGEEVVLDCADPLGEPAVIKRWTESQDTKLSIAGMVALESLDTIRQWYDSGEVKNIRVELHNVAGTVGGFYELPAICSEFKIESEGTANAKISAEISGAGRRVWTPAA